MKTGRCSLHLQGVVCGHFVAFFENLESRFGLTKCRVSSYFEKVSACFRKPSLYPAELREQVLLLSLVMADCLQEDLPWVILDPPRTLVRAFELEGSGDLAKSKLSQRDIMVEQQSLSKPTSCSTCVSELSDLDRRHAMRFEVRSSGWNEPVP